MSGGTFGYKQHYIHNIMSEIEYVIEKNNVEIPEKNLDIWQEKGIKYYEYPNEIIDKFKEAVKCLKKAYVYIQRIDWLLAGDDGDESFLKRLEEELKKLDNNEIFI